MVEYIVTIVNEIRNKEGVPDGIQFHNIYYESTLLDIYADAVGYSAHDSYESAKDWKKRRTDVNLVSSMNIGEGWT